MPPAAIGDHPGRQFDLGIKDGDEQGLFIFRRQQIIESRQGLRRPATRHGDGAQHGAADQHEEGGGNTLAGHVRHHHPQDAVAHLEDIIEVAAHLLGRFHAGNHVQHGQNRKLAGQDGQLHAGGDFQFLLQADELALVLQRLPQVAHQLGQLHLLDADLGRQARKTQGNQAQFIADPLGLGRLGIAGRLFHLFQFIQQLTARLVLQGRGQLLHLATNEALLPTLATFALDAHPRHLPHRLAKSLDGLGNATDLVGAMRQFDIAAALAAGQIMQRRHRVIQHREITPQKKEQRQQGGDEEDGDHPAQDLVPQQPVGHRLGHVAHQQQIGQAPPHQVGDGQERRLLITAIVGNQGQAAPVGERGLQRLPPQPLVLTINQLARGVGDVKPATGRAVKGLQRLGQGQGGRNPAHHAPTAGLHDGDGADHPQGATGHGAGAADGAATLTDLRQTAGPQQRRMFQAIPARPQQLAAVAQDVHAHQAAILEGGLGQARQPLLILVLNGLDQPGPGQGRLAQESLRHLVGGAHHREAPGLFQLL